MNGSCVLSRDHALSWFALHVRSNAERSAGRVLDEWGFETFLPTYKERRVWSDRIKEIDVPLFPGYLFCRFNSENRLRVITAPGILSVVGLGRAPVAIADHEIAAVQKIISADLKVRPTPFLQVGNFVRVQSGPLAGLEGIIQEFRRQHRLVVSVSLLHRSVAVELDSAWIRRISCSHDSRAAVCA